MLTTLAIVQVNLSQHGRASQGGLSSIPQRRFGGKSLLEWVVRRVTDSARLDGVIVVMDDGHTREQFSQLVPPDVPVFVSCEPDPLGRMAAAVREYRSEGVVRVSVANPFVDPALIDRLVTTAQSHSNCDYIGYCSSDGRAGAQSRLGVFAEWCRVEALKRADREATRPSDRQQPTRYLYCHPELFHLRLIPVPEQLDRDDVRLAINVEEDWEHVQAILDALGPESLDWQRIAGLLNHQPAMRERMADLNRADVRV